MKMKNYIKVLLFVFAGTFVFGACQKDDKTINYSVEGTYIGSFTTTSTLKSATTTTGNMMDTAIVKLIDNGQINIHCFGEEMDSTFILNTFQNGDSLMVCLEGQDFENEYGHMMGDGSMMGDGMMGNNSTEWGRHMNEEHKIGENHFGGFNMQNGTFSYSFKMMDNTSNNYRKFQGTKK